MNLRCSSLVVAVLAACGGSSASFTVTGDTAIMTGVINGRTPDRVVELLEAHPDLKRITLADVPGSKHDVANLEAARGARSGS